MKKLLLLITLTTSLISYSQTTNEEYRYLDSGYKKDIRDGRDIKSGYRMEPIYTYTSVNKKYIITYKAFIKEETNTMQAVIIKLHNTGNGKIVYRCLPIDNDALFVHAMKGLDVHYLNGSFKEEYMVSRFLLISKLAKFTPEGGLK